jgi:hypothetical protein
VSAVFLVPGEKQRMGLGKNLLWLGAALLFDFRRRDGFRSRRPATDIGFKAEGDSVISAIETPGNPQRSLSAGYRRPLLSRPSTSLHQLRRQRIRL